MSQGRHPRGVQRCRGPRSGGHEESPNVSYSIGIPLAVTFGIGCAFYREVSGPLRSLTYGVCCWTQYTISGRVRSRAAVGLVRRPFTHDLRADVSRRVVTKSYERRREGQEVVAYLTNRTAPSPSDVISFRHFFAACHDFYIPACYHGGVASGPALRRRRSCDEHE